MKNEFKIYAIYDTVGDVLRGDLTSKHKKYWDVKKAAQQIIDNNKNYSPGRLKVVEIECKVNKYV